MEKTLTFVRQIHKKEGNQLRYFSLLGEVYLGGCR